MSGVSLSLYVERRCGVPAASRKLRESRPSRGEPPPRVLAPRKEPRPAERMRRMAIWTSQEKSAIVRKNMIRSPSTGAIFGARYHLLEIVADRGMGETWRVRDKERSGALMSLKLLRAVDGEELPPRLLKAIYALKAIRCDGVPTILGHGVQDGRPWVVFDDLQGKSLGTLLDEARAEGELIALDLLRQVFTATAAAIRAVRVAKLPLAPGVLTPGSVIVLTKAVRDSPCAIVDLGISEWLDEPKDAPARSARMLIAKAPEQTSDAETTVATDVFVLGALFTEMLAVPAPPGLTLAAVTEDRRRPDVPASVWKALAKATAPEIATRFAGVPDLLGALDDAWKEAAKSIVSSGPTVGAQPSLLDTVAPVTKGPSLFPTQRQPNHEPVTPLGPLPALAVPPIPAAPNPWSTEVLRKEVLGLPLFAGAPPSAASGVETTAVLPATHGLAARYEHAPDDDVSRTIVQGDQVAEDVSATILTPPTELRPVLAQTLDAKVSAGVYVGFEAPMMNTPGSTIPVGVPIGAVVSIRPVPAATPAPVESPALRVWPRSLLVGGFLIACVLVALIAYRLGSN
jgi:serine/threonine protein kinase